MSLKNLLIPCLLHFLGDAVLLAQDTLRSDLSGTWKLNLQKSKVLKGSNIQPEILLIKCSGLSIDMSHTIDGKESKRSYIADEKERTLREVQRGEVVAKARWKKGVLTVETAARLKMPDQPYFNVIHTKAAGRCQVTGNRSALNQTIPRHCSSTTNSERRQSAV